MHLPFSILLSVGLGTLHFRTATVLSAIVHCNQNKGVPKTITSSSIFAWAVGLWNDTPSVIYATALMELTDTVHKSGEQISKSFTVSQTDDRIRSSQSVLKINQFKNLTAVTQLSNVSVGVFEDIWSNEARIWWNMKIEFGANRRYYVVTLYFIFPPGSRDFYFKGSKSRDWIVLVATKPDSVIELSDFKVATSEHVCYDIWHWTTRGWCCWIMLQSPDF